MALKNGRLVITESAIEYNGKLTLEQKLQQLFVDQQRPLFGTELVAALFKTWLTQVQNN